jgi:formylglycine-generating enzyme required for sulfatase activity
VVTEPPGAEVAVDGKPRGTATEGGLRVEGLDPTVPHRVRAALEDHEDGEAGGVVLPRERPLVLRLPRRKGVLHLEGAPPGAKVLLRREGGEPLEGTVPDSGSLSLAVEVGAYEVTVTLEGHEPLSRTARVAAGRTSTVGGALREVGATLSLATDPPGAEAFDGEVPLGPTPLVRRPLSPGTHALRLVHPERDDLRREVKVERGEDADLGTLALPPLAEIDLASLPGDATATLDGAPVSGTVRRKSGEARLVVARPGFRPKEIPLSLRPGDRVAPTVATAWEPATGRLDLSAFPADARLLLDGEPLEPGTRAVDLPPGVHRLRAERAGYEAVPEREVPVEADRTVRPEAPEWKPLAAVARVFPDLPPPPPPDLAGVTLPAGFVLLDGRIWCAKDGAEMVYVPAGEFAMGDDGGEADERPAHRVAVSGFLLDRHEVTVRQFRTFCRETRRPMPAQPGNSGDPCPVTGVTWTDAKQFAEWAGKRLPTEAEWEMAARGPEGRRFPWGAADDPVARNGSGSRDGFGDVAPADRFLKGASPCGAINMAGNVSEWVADGYDRAYYQVLAGLPSVPRDPAGPAGSKYRVVKGGAWNGVGEALRPACRIGLAPDASASRMGFRCAVPVASAPSPPR